MQAYMKKLIIFMLRLQGWPLVVSCDMNHFYGWLSHDEQDRISKLELFDEYEEWHDKCSHYMLLYAMKGTCQDLLPQLPQQSSDGTRPTSPLLLHSITVQATDDSCIFRR